MTTPELSWREAQYFLCICEYSLTTPWCPGRHCPQLQSVTLQHWERGVGRVRLTCCIRGLVVGRGPGWDGRQGLFGAELVEIQRGRPVVRLAGPRWGGGRQTLLATQPQHVGRTGLNTEVRQTDGALGTGLGRGQRLLAASVNIIIPRLGGGGGGGGGAASLNIPELLVLHLPL